MKSGTWLMILKKEKEINEIDIKIFIVIESERWFSGNHVVSQGWQVDGPRDNQ